MVECFFLLLWASARSQVAIVMLENRIKNIRFFMMRFLHNVYEKKTFGFMSSIYLCLRPLGRKHG